MDEKLAKNEADHVDMKKGLDTIRSTMTRGLQAMLLVGLSILITLVVALIRG
jgi:hypothetical protein